MPIYTTDDLGADTEVTRVSLGYRNIARVYYGSTQVFASEIHHISTDTATLDINTYLVGQGADYNQPQVIIIDSGVTVYSVSPGAYAIYTNALSAWVNGVTIVNYGSIFGQGGAADQDGGPAIYAISDIAIHNEGLIASGGGGGGTGGEGGNGDEIDNWSAYQNWGGNGGSPDYWWRWSDTNELIRSIYWASVRVGEPETAEHQYHVNGSYGYQKGDLQVNTVYKIRRGDYTQGTKGAGGAGGVGEGYGQSPTNGAAGTAGTNRAGDGGGGGNGGTYGQPGSAGQRGLAGKYYSQTSDNASSAGLEGNAGGLAGYVIYTADGGGGIPTVYYSGSGQLLGRVN